MQCHRSSHRKIHRYAKYLLFGLDNGWIVCHLRMEGKLYYLSEPMIDKHTHVVFHLSSGNDLVYKDVRKFGRMIFKKDNELFQTAPLLHVGVEANCSCYDLAVIYNKIHRKKSQLKRSFLISGSFPDWGIFMPMKFCIRRTYRRFDRAIRYKKKMWRC